MPGDFAKNLVYLFATQSVSCELIGMSTSIHTCVGSCALITYLLHYIVFIDIINIVKAFMEFFGKKKTENSDYVI